jgi:hypothetical protein
MERKLEIFTSGTKSIFFIAVSCSSNNTVTKAHATPESVLCSLRISLKFNRFSWCCRINKRLASSSGSRRNKSSFALIPQFSERSASFDLLIAQPPAASLHNHLFPSNSVCIILSASIIVFAFACSFHRTRGLTAAR